MPNPTTFLYCNKHFAIVNDTNVLALNAQANTQAIKNPLENLQTTPFCTFTYQSPYVKPIINSTVNNANLIAPQVITVQCFAANQFEQLKQHYTWHSARDLLNQTSDVVVGDSFNTSSFNSGNSDNYHFNNAQWFEYSRGLQLAQWVEEFKFCHKCASVITPLNTQYDFTQQATRQCPNCGYEHYPKISPCVIGVVSRNNQILLARHLRHATPIYTLIAGFVEVGETIENAFKREVFEECGLTVDTPNYIASQPWPFSSQLMLGMTANYVAGNITIDTNELVDAQFFAVDNLPLLPAQGTISRYLIDQFVQSVTCSKA